MNNSWTFVCLFISVFAAADLRAQVTLNPNPSRVIGQLNLNVNSLAPNLVDGRKLNSPGAVAIDTTSSPPILYVTDSGNNRILAWRNAAQLTNGAPADRVIGQSDFFSTFPQGPGRGVFSTGMTGPSGITVDSAGNLYVVDSGNNRVLRFPKPFNQPDQILPDLVIGQPTFNTRGTNQGGMSSTTLAMNSDPSYQDCLHSNCYDASLAFDGAGNLYVADPLNNRVVRYPASELGSNATSGPPADLVLGQSNFTTAQYDDDPTLPNHLKNPAGLAFDPGGRLYVSDALSRVVVYLAPFRSGQAATRFLGIPVQLPNQPPPPLYSESRFNQPEGLFMVNNMLGVADVGNNRLLIFPPYETWSGSIYTQGAQYVVGQSNFTDHLANQGSPQAAATSLSAPFNAAFFNNALYVADTLNNRVVVFPRQPGGGFPAATQVLGQLQFNFNTANLIEGRELHLVTANSQGSFGDGGLIVDTTSNPPHLYVSDPYNNRILGFRDVRTIQTGATADLVIGQPDLFNSLVNAPANNPNQLNDQGLFLPTGLALDPQGNLYVADSLNSRVLRFHQPFAGGNFPHADLVLGQSSFSAHITDPTRATMNLPYGVAFTPDSAGLLVSDAAQNRVLLFAGSPQQLTNGMPATKVFGQPNFFSTASGQTANRFNGPRSIAVDRNRRLYVTDAGNNRVSIFEDVINAGPDPSPVLSLTAIDQNRSMQSPRGIYLNPATGEFWVASQDDNGNGVVARYANFDSVTLSGVASETINEVVPIAVTEDGDGNLYVADFANRVVIHYAAIAALNGASFLNRPLSPGTVASLFPVAGAKGFGTKTASFNQLPKPLPLPKTMVDIQVLVNGQQAPLYYVSPGQINMLVPENAPTSGTAEVDVMRASTGQILGSYTVPMDVASPGLFLRGATQVAALNQDNSINSAQNPAATGTVIQLFATGPGPVPGGPTDGNAPTGAVATPYKPRVVINPASGFVPDQDVTYSGLAPGLVGVWQINVRIPKSVPPGSSVPIFIIYRDISSINTGQLNTTIAVKQP